MAQFVLLLHQPVEGGGEASPEQMQAVVERYNAWSEEMAKAGKLTGGQKLTEDPGRVLRANGDGITQTDGPYSETKEVMGGFFIVKASDYSEAVEISESCPHLGYGGTIELRQIDEIM